MPKTLERLLEMEQQIEKLKSDIERSKPGNAPPPDRTSDPHYRRYRYSIAMSEYNVQFLRAAKYHLGKDISTVIEEALADWRQKWADRIPWEFKPLSAAPQHPIPEKKAKTKTTRTHT